MEAVNLSHKLIKAGKYLDAKRYGRPAQMRILYTLNRAGTLTQKDLQSRLQVQQGTLSETVRKLIAKGYILTDTDPADRRKVLLSLSMEGKEQVRRNHCLYRRENERIFAALSAKEQAQLYELLNKLIDSWQEEK